MFKVLDLGCFVFVLALIVLVEFLSFFAILFFPLLFYIKMIM